MGETVIAIDPGPVNSAYVEICDGHIVESGIVTNYALANKLKSTSGQFAVIEMIASYGMPVGKDVFETCLWVGRFVESVSCSYALMYRKDVKMHLCGSTRAKDSNVRQALIDLYGPGKEKAIGKKKTPGPLYGIKKDMWAALAVAVTWSQRNPRLNIAKECLPDAS
jgi:hypothetical protein